MSDQNLSYLSFVHYSTVIYQYHIDGLVQDRSNSSALAMGLLQSCAK